MQSIVSGLYWHKSLFVAMPVILRLDGSTLMLKTRKGIEWQVPISETMCRFTTFGTMILNVNQKEYALLVAGSAMSQSFNKDQLAELAQANGQYSASADMAVRLGTATSTLGSAGAVGAPVATAAYATVAAGNIETWRDIFKSLSLLSSKDKVTNVRRNLLLLLVGSMVVGLILALVISSMGS